jgi:heptaprenyl diphosphate synthase
MLLQNKKHYIYILSVVLTSFFYITETWLPKPVPWMRLGFSNIIFMILIYNPVLNFKDIVLILVFRNIISSVILGVLFTPIFVLSFCASFCSVSVMYILKNIFKQRIGFIGLSINGACINILVQFFIGTLLFFKSLVLFNLIIYFLVFSYITGIVNGYISEKIYLKLKLKKNILV